jgi:hypothetical protein
MPPPSLPAEKTIPTAVGCLLFSRLLGGWAGVTRIHLCCYSGRVRDPHLGGPQKKGHKKMPFPSPRRARVLGYPLDVSLLKSLSDLALLVLLHHHL